jgi:hypothetical protein
MVELLEEFPLLLRGRTARSLSKLIEKSEGRDVAGCTIERAGRDGNLLTWRLLEIVSVSTPTDAE